MIAAGVTGRCTNDPSKIPDIRKYEAQDLVAASFLYECSKDPDLHPAEAKARDVEAFVSGFLSGLPGGLARSPR